MATAGMIASEFLDQEDVKLKLAFSAEISVVQEASSHHRDCGGTLSSAVGGTFVYVVKFDA